MIEVIVNIILALTVLPIVWAIIASFPSRKEPRRFRFEDATDEEMAEHSRNVHAKIVARETRDRELLAEAVADALIRKGFR